MSNEDIIHEKARIEKMKKVDRIMKMPLKPLNPKQATYITAIENNAVTLAIGSAGTSKTYIPSIMAADMFMKGEITKIVICRPMEGPGKAIGTLPGDKNEKMEEWLTPVTSTLRNRLGGKSFDYYLGDNSIEFCPLNLLQGRSFDDAFIILDEGQNAEIDTIKSVVTRIGQNTKLVINGDIKQKNIRQESGLWYIINLIKKHDLPVPVIEFTLDDCVRSKITKMFLEVFEAEEDENA